MTMFISFVPWGFIPLFLWDASPSACFCSWSLTSNTDWFIRKHHSVWCSFGLILLNISNVLAKFLMILFSIPCLSFRSRWFLTYYYWPLYLFIPLFSVFHLYFFRSSYSFIFILQYLKFCLSSGDFSQFLFIWITYFLPICTLWWYDFYLSLYCFFFFLFYYLRFTSSPCFSSYFKTFLYVCIWHRKNS